MCGIAGVLRVDGARVRPDLLREMVSRLAHRGPDSRGVATLDGVGLGHARLSIIDPALGRQPMSIRDGELTLTYNGEIFNYLELRDELAGQGHRFRTGSDTEVVLRAYDEYGVECVHHFNGQWAFALWDARRRRLFLSRDRLGIRPLFYARTKKTGAREEFVFASEVKALFAHPGVDRAFDHEGLNQLFTLWATLPPRTAFEGVRELPPAHNAVIEGRDLRIWRYWELRYPDSSAFNGSGARPGGNGCGSTPDRLDAPDEPHAARTASEDAYAEELLALLSDATRLRLRSDVPVGAYLSGGLDSSVTTALIRENTGNRLRTFSISFTDAEFDESGHQRDLAEFLGTEHQSVRCTHSMIAEAFPDVVRHAEKPLLRTAPAPLFLLSRLVREEGFKVVLTGEGADELLGGYDIFKEAKIRRFCAAHPESDLRARLFLKLYPYMPELQSQPPAFRRAFFGLGQGELDDPLFSHRRRWSMTSGIRRLFSRDLREGLGHHDVEADVLDSLPRDFRTWDPFCQAQYLEATILMPGYILSSQGDRVSLAHAVEGRFPFLDHRVAEFSTTLPPRLKMRVLNEKYLLKKAAGHLIPRSVLERPKQPYRAPDVAAFFDARTGRPRHDYVGELLSEEHVREAGVFEPRAVRGLTDKVRRSGGSVGTRDGMALVGILSTQLLFEQFIRRDTSLSPGGVQDTAIPLSL